jgi:two-component system, LuxR family, sensor kinase FixL
MSIDIETARVPGLQAPLAPREMEPRTAEQPGLQERLDERLRFEALLVDLSAAFVRLPADEVDTYIEQGQRQLVEFLGVERSSFAEYVEGKRHFRVTHSYVVPGFPPFPLTIADEALPWLTAKVHRGEVVRLRRMPEDFPPEAVEEREHVLRVGVKSNLTIPLKVGGSLVGALTFGSFRTYQDWPDDLVRRLQLVGEIFANALARKRADFALREREERFRLLANAAPVLVWMSGPDKLCTYFNKPWLDFTGRPLERELGDGWSEGVHPDDLPRCLDTYVRAFDARQEFRMEYRLRRSDGEYRWVLDAGVPRFESDGTFDGYLGSCVDITEQKRVEEALRESEARLRHLLESTNAVPWVCDAHSWRFTYVGPQAGKLLGYPADDWYGESFWTDHMHPDDRGWAPAFCRDHAQRDTDYEFDYRMVAADGRTVWLHDVVNVIQKDGAPALLRGFLIDVTRRKEAEANGQLLRDQLAHVGRVATMGELAASIAHEINQPLSAIVSNAQTAECFLAGPNADLAEVRAALEDIRSDGQRASEVIGRIRSLLKRDKVVQAALDLNQVARGVVPLVRDRLARERVVLQLELADDTPPVRGDRVQLQQVILNLLVNGIEALRGVADGRRRLALRTARMSDRGAVLAVSDSGPGVPAEVRDHLFDPFFTTKPGGMGMGLAISRSIVQDHGGRIDADNNAAGGATFSFTLPGI